MQLDPNAQQALRMARYLSAVSMFARGVGILGVIGSVIGVLAAMSMRRSDDRVGFSLISLGVLLIAFVVWSAATFHGMQAKLAPLVVRLDERLEALETRQRLLATMAVAPPVAVTPAPAPAEAAPAPPAPDLAPAWPVAAASEVASAPAPVASQVEPIATPPEPIASQAVPVAPEPEPAPAKPEPVRTPCPSCGGLIHPEATRCVHCMKRVARA